MINNTELSDSSQPSLVVRINDSIHDKAYRGFVIRANDGASTGDALHELATKDSTRQTVQVEIASEMNVHHSTKHAEYEHVISLVSAEIRVFDNHLFEKNEIDRYGHRRAEEDDDAREHHQGHLPFDGLAMRRRTLHGCTAIQCLLNVLYRLFTIFANVVLEMMPLPAKDEDNAYIAEDHNARRKEAEDDHVDFRPDDLVEIVIVRVGLAILQTMRCRSISTSLLTDTGGEVMAIDAAQDEEEGSHGNERVAGRTEQLRPEWKFCA